VKIAIIGKPRSGKTTLVKGIYHILKNQGREPVGFYTEEIRRAGRRYGFDMVNLNGERLPLARVGSHSPFKVGKYAVFIDSIEKTLKELMPQANKNSILIIDEIGKMELLYPPFAEFIENIWQSLDSIIVTIPITDIHPLVKSIRNTADITVNLDSQKVEPQMLAEKLMRQM